ncbi:MAG: TonB-dependent receptor [Pseudomonadota bacterium]
MNKCIWRSAAMASMLMGTTAPAAFAQEAPTFAGAEEIMVISRRKSERLQDAPATVSVITESTIENTGVRVATDFLQLVPGVSIVAGPVEAGDVQINIRGANGARDGESNVALVVDGILKSNIASLNQDQGVLRQIEVLKGPQGALYGRNAAAGAIVLTTAEPTDELSGEGLISYGNFDTLNLRALISGPISDNLGFMVNADYSRTDGFLENSFFPTAENQEFYPGNTSDPNSINNKETWNINGRLFFEPTDETTIDVKLRYGELTAGAISFNAIFNVPLFADLFGPAFNLDANEHEFLFTPNVDPLNEQSTLEGSIKLEHAFDFADLTAWVAYNKIDQFFYADATSGTFGFFNAQEDCAATLEGLGGFPVQSPFGIGGGAFLPPYSPTTCDGTQYQQNDQEDISAELRLAGSWENLDWQLGVYFLHLDRRICRNLGLDTGNGVLEECFTTDARNPTEALADDDFTTNVYAFFGSVDYEVVEDFNVSVALRYDIEDRKVSNNVPTDARTRWVGLGANIVDGDGVPRFPNGTADTPAGYFLNPGLDPVFNPGGLPDQDQTFKQIQPKISLSYRVNEDLNIFANWGIGFKSGGFNNGGSQAIVDGFFNNLFNSGITLSDVFDKETSSVFEVGLKGSLADNRIRYEIAGYYSDVTDMQFFGFYVGPFGLLRIVSNIDEVEIMGIEADITASVTDWLTVFASANVNDSEIKANSARPNTVGNKSPYTADYTLNLGMEVLYPATEGMDFLLRADYRLTGPTWFHTVQDNDVPTQFGADANFTNSQRDAFGVLNLRTGLQFENVSVTVFANNILDKGFLAEVIPAPEFGGSFVAPGMPRSYGLELRANF